MKNYKNKLLTAALLFAAVLLASPMKAQVTIGAQLSPDKNALLELRSSNADSSTTKGFLPPRVKLSSTTLTSPMVTPVANGLTVYNTATTGDVTPGYYYWDAAVGKWVRVGNGGTAVPKYFYMPSIVLPLDNSDTSLFETYTAGTQTFTVDLYKRYSTQYAMAATFGGHVKSPGAVDALPVYTAAQLEYFVTYYDTSVFTNVSVSDTGILTYSLLPSPLPLSDKTFMNIIFEVKPNI